MNSDNIEGCLDPTDLQKEISKLTFRDISLDSLTEESFQGIKEKLERPVGSYLTLGTFVPNLPSFRPSILVSKKRYDSLRKAISLYNECLYIRELLLAYVYHAFEKVLPGWQTSWLTVNRIKVIFYLTKLTSWHRWIEVVCYDKDYVWYRFFPYADEMVYSIQYPTVRTMLQIWLNERNRQTRLAPPSLRTNEPFILVSLTLEELARYLITSRNYRAVKAFLCKSERRTLHDDSISRWTRSWFFEPHLLEVISNEIYNGNLVFKPHLCVSVSDESLTPQEVKESKVNMSSDDLGERVSSFPNLTPWERFVLYQCMIAGEAGAIESDIKKEHQDTYRFDNFKDDPIFRLGRIAYIHTPGYNDFIERCTDHKRQDVSIATIHFDVYGSVSQMVPFLKYLKKMLEKSKSDTKPDAYIYPSYVDMRTFVHLDLAYPNRFSLPIYSENEGDDHEDNDDGIHELIDCQDMEWLEVYPLD